MKIKIADILKYILFIFIFAFLGFSAGCGIYSFSGSTIPSNIKTVGIPLFENNTPEFGIDQQITDALIEAISADNTLKIADTRNADSILKGTILQITDRAGQYDANENASSYRITINIKVSFEDVKKRKVFWEETWSQWGQYESDRNQGIKDAVSKLTTDILNKTVSGW
ncbi:LptE family protein [bacterium]|nr:LptE family protein [bacterium]